jgi:FHA domain
MKLIIEDREGVRTAAPLPGGETTVGRGEGNQVHLDARNVSRRHARLRRQRDGFVLEDLGSLTGVRVNGARIAAPTQVTEDDVIEIGDYALALAGDEARGPARLTARAHEARLGRALERETRASTVSAPPPSSPGHGQAGPLRLLCLGLGALALLLLGVGALLAPHGSPELSRSAMSDTSGSSGRSAPDAAARDAAARKALNEGEARLHAHDAAGAIARFQRAIGEKPSQHLLGLAYRGLGMAYVAVGDGKRGASYLKLYLPLCPAPERPGLEAVIARYGK